MNHPLFRAVFDLCGIVQGVGFRPALYRLAARWGLTGSVVNTAGSVRLVLEGRAAELDAFLAALPANLPANARIDRLALVERGAIEPAARAHAFTIGESAGTDPVHVVIPPDLKMCADCLRELMDPADRRYGYPFTTCTVCGPRYTVVERMPYDRARTTMSDFPMCPACRREYENPRDRRFHAETIACPRCGPTLRLETAEGERLDSPLPSARQALARGEVVAVRGIGGFLLAADAHRRDTLRRLRTAKGRPHKPFAVMGPDIATLRRYCRVAAEAERLLSSPAAPVLILEVLPDAVHSGRLPLDLIAPDTMTLGVMLPTSPLHHLLLEPLADDPLPRFDLLVMTSGNRRGEPICRTNEEARQRLGGIADKLLLHDRRIELRNDDSVCVLREGEPQLWRRARGYAPGAVMLRKPLRRRVLAMGAELKSAVAFGDEGRVVLSPHIGDLETPEALEGLRTVVERLPAFLARQPERIAVDLHPDMHATRMGMALARRLDVPVVRVQHHHAHGAAGMAEHGLDHALVLCFDGTGLGPDGAIWGAELLEISAAPCAEPFLCDEDSFDNVPPAPGFRRWATFAPVPLPGADAAVRQPVRQLIARWLDAGCDLTPPLLERLGVAPSQVDIWARQCRQGINAPRVHSAGRLFDAFSALLGLPPGEVTYEGQAAIRLEAAACRAAHKSLPTVDFATRREGDLLLIDWRPAFAAPGELARLRARPDPWALAFHHAVARAALTMIDYGFTSTGIRDVVLSGGVFMNRVLSDRLAAACRENGFRVFLHRQSPPNDGCIALGQAVIAGN